MRTRCFLGQWPIQAPGGVGTTCRSGRRCDDGCVANGWLWHMLLIVAAIPTMDGCNNGRVSERQSASVIHPRDELRYRPVEVISRIALTSAPSLEHPLRRMMQNAGRATSIGQPEGAPSEVFGKIADVEVDSEDRIFVLDSYNHAVRIFGSSGQYLGSFGAAGRGPGEFVDPRQLLIDDAGVVYVLDVYQVHRFIPTVAGFEFDRSLHFDFEPVDLCALGHRLFIHGVTFHPEADPLEPTPLVAEVAGGEVVSFFGDVYGAPDAMVSMHVERCMLLCDSYADRIVLGPLALLGELHAYSGARKPAWITVIDGFRPTVFERTARGTRTRIPDLGYDRLDGLIPIEPTPPGLERGLILLQVAYLSREDYDARADVTVLRSFVVDSKAGSITPLGEGLPRVEAFGKRFYVSSQRDPYPQLRVHPWRVPS